MAGRRFPFRCLAWGLALVLAALAGTGCNSRAGGALLGGGSRLHPFLIPDPQMGGMSAYRIGVPPDWRTSSRVAWNYRDLYRPVTAQFRAEAPDGRSWVEFFPAEVFVWVTPRLNIRVQSVGGIEHPDITLPEAMVRYVIAPNRKNAQGLRILGGRSVDLSKAFPRFFTHLQAQGFGPGQGICLRVRYELDGVPVDEEFYGYMPAGTEIPSNGAVRLVEHRRALLLVHSLGACSGQLEKVRSQLGAVATSLELNEAWSRRVQEVNQQQVAAFQRQLAQGYARIEAAGRMSRMLSAQNDAFLQRMDARRTAQNSRSSVAADREAAFAQRTDDFDQFIRGTEHMVDQNGAVSDQYTDYNYHWTDGFGSVVHTNDADVDPNRYLSGGHYERMTPLR